MNKIKRIMQLLFCCFFMMTLVACDDVEDYEVETQDAYNDDISRNTEDTWVIYWYLCGSDLESLDGAATADLEEMMSVSLPENVKVVIQSGGTNEWMNSYMDPTKIQRFVYSGDQLELVDELDQSNMGSADTLEGFLTYCEEEFPADHKMMLFWNHGGGSLGGAAYDENYDYDSLSLSEMQLAFEAVYGEQEKPFELVGFDTCLMATLDTANIFKDYSNFLVASEELEPGNGWEYSGWLNELAKNPGMNGAELGTIICDSFMVGCKALGLENEITLSVIDLNKLDPLLLAFHNLGTEILSSAISNPSVCGEFARSAQSAENYGGNNDQDGYTNMVDLGDLVVNAENLLPETASSILDSLNDAVVYKVNGAYRQNASGLSVYYSYNGDTNDLNLYKEIATDQVYPNFISYSLGEDISEEVSTQTDEIEYEDAINLDGFHDDMSVEITEDNYARLTIDPENLDSVKSVFFNLAYFSEEDDLMLFLGRDNDLNIDWENGIFEDNFRGVWGAIDESLCYMEITYEGDDYNLYSVPIYLNDEESVMRVAYDFNEEVFKILGVRKDLTEQGTMGDKNLLQLNTGDEVIPILYAMTLSDENYNEEEFLSDSIIVTDSTYFAETSLIAGDYAFNFEIVDIRNQSYTSDVAYLEYEE